MSIKLEGQNEIYSKPISQIDVLRVSPSFGKTVFELYAEEIDIRNSGFTNSARPTSTPSSRPTTLGGNFMGIDHDIDPD